MSTTEPTNERVAELTASMRATLGKPDNGHVFAAAIGRIDVIARSFPDSAEEKLARICDVLAAMDVLLDEVSS